MYNVTVQQTGHIGGMGAATEGHGYPYVHPIILVEAPRSVRSSRFPFFFRIGLSTDAWRPDSSRAMGTLKALSMAFFVEYYSEVNVYVTTLFILLQIIHRSWR